ncbi:MAG: molecular chaperone DnaK, partial [Thermoplasmata archaeon]
IGIDLGTSNSAAAVVISGKPVVIPSAEGNTLGGKAFPSYVAFTKDGQLLVGEPARRQALLNPEGTVYAVKRKMGTNYKYNIFGKEYTPQQLSAFILQKIKRDAEAFLGEKITKAVITVPAYFDDNQRQATKDAGTIAGLEVVRIINEPTAASLAYGIDKLDKEQKIIVYDFGGGTLDVTIMEFGNGVFEVLSTSGDTQLGGTDMDNAIIDYITSEFYKKEKIDLKNDKQAYIRLREAAEKAKIELSTSLETEINLPYIAMGSDGPKHLVMKLTRAKLEELVRPIVERTGESIKKALEAAKLTKDDIDKIILVGGPTRMPIVQRYVEEFFGKKIERGVDPMEAVAIGAAIQGAILAGEIKDIVLLDVTPLTLSVETLGGIATPIIPANTTIPTRKSQIFTTAADFQTTVTIHVVQGERPLAKDNVSLGMFNLEGIPPAPRGVPQIEVTFDIDANGILHVTAKDLATGKQNSITITSTTKLSKEEIERMKKEAETFAEQDRKKKEEIETINEAESLVYSSERFINENRDKLDQSKVTEAEKIIKDLKSYIESRDIENIKKSVKELQNKIQDLGASMYRKVNISGDENKSNKTVDADFKDKENDKK